MNKFLTVTMLATLFAGCCTERDVYDIRPGEEDDGIPVAVAWQNDHNAELEAAMKPAALAKYVKSAAAADALLAEVKPAYATDPMVATRIGAISQLVMCPKCTKAPACRKLWTAALLRAAEGSVDAYRTMFFLDQLRWCGTRDQVAGIRAVGVKAREKCVQDFALWVARELEGR